MNPPNGLPSFGVAFGGLAGFSYPHGTTEPRLDYRGMSVQAVKSPSSVHFGSSHADQNDAHPVNPLNGFHVTSLTQAVPGGFDELELPVIPESVLDEYVPWNTEKESVDDALFPVQGSCLYNQSLFSGNEPDVSEPAPANRLSPDHHLTDLPTELVNPLSLRQATSDNPANSADSIADGKSSKVKSQKERKRERQRERYQNDTVYAERHRERQRERYQNDPSYAEGLKIYAKIYKKMKKNFSKEEASRLALLAKKQYLQSVNSPKDSGDLPQASKPTKTTRNSNKNSDVLPLPLSN